MFASKFVLVLIFSMFGLSYGSSRVRVHHNNLKQSQNNFTNTKNPSLHGRLAGGQRAADHSQPYQAYISVNRTLDVYDMSACSGVLISQKYVLTTGYCLKGAHSADVSLGATRVLDMDLYVAIYRSEQLIIHEEFGGSDDAPLNDIGLVKLLETVEYSDIIKAIPLSNDINKSYQGKNVTLSGWNVTSYYVLGVLIEAFQNVISNEACQILFPSVTNSQLCSADYQGVSACIDDTGYAVTLDDKLIGLVSYGISSCAEFFPTVATRVDSYLDWIQKNSDVIVA